jgi:hypothetical protein
MGHKGVSKRKPKQIRGTSTPEATISAGRSDPKDAPITASQAPKAVEKSISGGGTDKKRKGHG